MAKNICIYFFWYIKGKMNSASILSAACYTRSLTLNVYFLNRYENMMRLYKAQQI